MNTFIKVIGIMVVSAQIVSIPLLCGLSFALGWHPFIQFISIVGTAGVFGFIALNISNNDG